MRSNSASVSGVDDLLLNEPLIDVISNMLASLPIAFHNMSCSIHGVDQITLYNILIQELYGIMFVLVGEIIGKFADRLVGAGFAVDIAMHGNLLDLKAEKDGTEKTVSLELTELVVIITSDERIESDTIELEEELQKIFRVGDANSKVGEIVGKTAGQLASSLLGFNGYGVDIGMRGSMIALSVAANKSLISTKEEIQIHTTGQILKITTADRTIKTNVAGLQATLRQLFSQYHRAYNQLRAVLSEYADFTTTSMCLGQFNVSIAGNIMFQLEMDDVSADVIDSPTFGGFLTTNGFPTRNRFDDVGALRMMLLAGVRIRSSAQLWDSIKKISNILEHLL